MNTSWPIGKSILLHIIVFASLFVGFQFHSHYAIPSKAHHIVMARLVTTQSHQQKDNDPILKRYKDGTVRTKNHLALAHIPHIKQHEKHQKISGRSINKLIIELYTQIAEHEVYPDESKLLHQTGKAVVHFKLHVNGSVSDVHLVHHTNFKLLDSAAVQTILASEPFPHVSHYLNHAQAFNMPIVFALRE